MVGLPEVEQRVLKSVGRISSVRTNCYEFDDLGKTPDGDIVVVDGDSPQAMQSWRDAALSVPVLFFGSGNDAGQTWLKRPIMGMRLLALLDEIMGSSAPAAPKPETGGSGATVAAAMSNIPSPPPHRSLALVVDDSPTVRKGIELGLAPFGLSLHFAETGEEALERLATTTYDIVFLDVVLPGIDGYAVCKVIKKDKGMKKTPVIMLTGKSSTFDRIKGSLAGCDTYLTKPVEFKVFQDVVKKYLGDTIGVMLGTPSV